MQIERSRKRDAIGILYGSASQNNTKTAAENQSPVLVDSGSEDTGATASLSLSSPAESSKPVANVLYPGRTTVTSTTLQLRKEKFYNQKPPTTWISRRSIFLVPVV